MTKVSAEEKVYRYLLGLLIDRSPGIKEKATHLLRFTLKNYFKKFYRPDKNIKGAKNNEKNYKSIIFDSFSFFDNEYSFQFLFCNR